MGCMERFRAQKGWDLEEKGKVNGLQLLCASLPVYFLPEGKVLFCLGSGKDATQTLRHPREGSNNDHTNKRVAASSVILGRGMVAHCVSPVVQWCGVIIPLSSSWHPSPHVTGSDKQGLVPS